MSRGGDSTNYNSDEDIEIQVINNPVPLSSLTRKRDDHIPIAELSRRKQLRTTIRLVESSPASASEMIWSRDDELLILKGIVDYQIKKKSRYDSDWDSFYYYIKDSLKTNFTKQQLADKIAIFKKRFIRYQEGFGGRNGSSTINPHDDEVLQLSMIIWPFASTLKMVQTSVLNSSKYVPRVLRGQVINISTEINNVEKDKSEEDGVDEFCAMQNALGETTLFQSIDQYQQKKLLQNLENLGAPRKKELTDEWKALLVEDARVKIKKQSFSAKLAFAGLSS